MKDNLIGKKVIIVDNTSDGFTEGTQCFVISKCNYCQEDNCYNLKGYWCNKLMEFEHHNSDFKLIEIEGINK